MLNNESSSTYIYGWKVVGLEDEIIISGDAVKPYYQTDIRRMHLDNNIIKEYNTYKISLYV